MGPEVNQDTTPTKMMVRKVDSLICGMTIKIGGGVFEVDRFLQGSGGFASDPAFAEPLNSIREEFPQAFGQRCFFTRNAGPPPPRWSGPMAGGLGVGFGAKLRKTFGKCPEMARFFWVPRGPALGWVGSRPQVPIFFQHDISCQGRWVISAISPFVCRGGGHLVKSCLQATRSNSPKVISV